MLDEKKVRLMARTALYEQSFGSGAIKLNRHFRKGTKRAAFLMQIPSGILTFFLVAALFTGALKDRAILLYESLGPVASALAFAGCGILFVFLYAVYAYSMTKRNYEADKGAYWKYVFTKEKLEKTAETGKKDPSGQPENGKA